MDLNAFFLPSAFSIGIPGCGYTPSPLDYQTTTIITQLREIWFISLYLVLVHLELVPSPSGNHVINRFSVQVSYLTFIACQR